MDHYALGASVTPGQVGWAAARLATVKKELGIEQYSLAGKANVCIFGATFRFCFLANHRLPIGFFTGYHVVAAVSKALGVSFTHPFP